MGWLRDALDGWRVRRIALRAARRAEAAVARYAETLASRAAADLAIDDAGWRKLSDATGAYDLSTADLADIRARSIELWRLDPTVAHAVALLFSGAFRAGSLEPKAADERVQAVVSRWWEDKDNALALTSRSGLERHHLALMLEGERFLTVFTSPADATVRLGEVRPGEITQIITHPENWRRPVAYRREYRAQSYDVQGGRYAAAADKKVEVLLDWRLAPEVAEGRWDDDAALQELLARLAGMTREDAYCYHAALPGLGLRGVPGVWRAYEWTRAHGQALSSMMTLSAAQAMFAWQKKVTTSSATTLERFAATYDQPTHGPGAMHVSNDAVDLQPINVSTGGTQVQENTARQMHLQAIRAFGFGEHWYGNADSGNLATATAMELPAVWRIEGHQALIRQTLEDLLGFAVAVAVAREGGLPADVDRAVSVSMPDAQPATPGETAQLLQALTVAAQSGLIDPREASLQAYQALGTQEINAVMERQYPAERKLDDEPGTSGGVPVVPTEGLAPQAAAIAEARAQEAVRPFWRLSASAELEAAYAAALEARVLAPWWRAVRAWLRGLDAQTLPASAAMRRQALERAVPVDRQELFAVMSEYNLQAANLAGAAALETIVQAMRRGGEAFVRAEEAAGPRTLAERLQAGEEWEQVASGELVFNLRDPKLLRALAARGEKITGEVSQSMIDDLHALLERDIYRAGMNPVAIADELETIFPATYRDRAINIARTEMAVAQGMVTHATLVENGIEQRQWFAFMDSATRPEHAAAHGQVRGINEPFDVGGEALMHPGDPAGSAANVCGCRCDELPVVGEGTALPAQPWLGGYQPLTAAAKANAAPISE
jgi:hypothetical protein